MGASQIALDSILVSPKSGMDRKGVPGSTGSKSDLKSSYDFDQTLMRQVDSSADRASSHLDKSKKVDSKVSEERPDHARRVEKESVEAKPKATAKTKTKAKDGDEGDREISNEETNVSSQKSAREPSPQGEESPSHVALSTNVVESVKENAKEGASAELDEVLLSQIVLPPAELQENENNSAMSENGLNEAIASDTSSSQVSTELSKAIQLSALPSTNLKLDSKAQLESQKKSEGLRAQNFFESIAENTNENIPLSQTMPEADEFTNQDEALAFRDSLLSKQASSDLLASKDVSTKPLKHFVDSLLIQQNLAASSNGSSPSLFATKVNVLLNEAASESSKPHFTSDIKPIIHEMAMKDKGGEMTVSLRPAHLGWVRVNVQVEEGAVKVDLQTETSQAKSLLESQVKDLHQSLKSSGLKLEDVSIAMSPSISNAKSSDSMNDQSGQQPNRDSEEPKRDQHEQRQPSSQQKHRDEVFAEMMKERNAA